MNPVGIAAALATAMSWAICALFFTASGRRIGVFSMNHWRVLTGALLLAIAHTAIFGSPIPKAQSHELVLLILSGIVGVVIGDTFLFQSYIDIGPRMGALIFNTNPLITACAGWVFLQESLSAKAIAGIVITIGGVIWVASEESPNGGMPRSPHHLRGVIFAVLAAVGQSCGFLIAKPAMNGTGAVDPLSASLIRVAAAVVGFWAIGLVRGRTRGVLRDFKDTKAMIYLFCGAVMGPFIGIWLSMLALKLIPAGVAATLISTMPVLILPLVVVIHKERLSWRAIVGAMIAVAGVAVLANS